jgi:hypothetical protein
MPIPAENQLPLTHWFASTAGDTGYCGIFNTEYSDLQVKLVQKQKNVFNDTFNEMFNYGSLPPICYNFLDGLLMSSAVNVNCSMRPDEMYGRFARNKAWLVGNFNDSYGRDIDDCKEFMDNTYTSLKKSHFGRTINSGFNLRSNHANDYMVHQGGNTSLLVLFSLVGDWMCTYLNVPTMYSGGSDASRSVLLAPAVCHASILRQINGTTEIPSYDYKPYLKGASLRAS